MSLHTKVSQWLVVVGTFIASFLVQNECIKLEGYKFPVYTTAFCPRIQTEWIERSSALKCNKSNGYMCLPNENIDQLLEFCYREPVERIQEGICLYLVKSVSLVQSYNCSRFTQGCPNHSFFSNEIFKYPACISIGNRCFLAEPSCKSIGPPHIQSTTQQFENVLTNEWNGSTTTHPQQSSEHPQLDNAPLNGNDDALFVPILLGIVIPFCFLSLLCAFYINRKYQICRTNGDVESPGREKRTKSNNEGIHKGEEIEPLLGDGKGADSREKEEIKAIINADQKIIRSLENYEESRIEKAIFDQWNRDDSCFISTKACDEVEKIIKNRNLVIVAGHSGSGKSAIIQHIALKYREQGWTVKRVKKVKDIVDEYSSRSFQEHKTICVFNDPLGRESFDEIWNNSWQTNEEEIKLYLKTAKLVMSSRNYISFDTRVARNLGNQSHIVNIDDNKYKLSVIEKRQILNKYTSDMKLSNKDRDKIVEVERYFPLLCKLYSSKEEYKHKGIEFFTEPVTVLKEEILGFRSKDKGKYCALALLVLFNDDLCVNDLLKNKDNENKFKQMLKLCGLQKRTPPSAIEDNFSSMKDCFVKKIGDTYHFYHDFVMEVITYVFGTDYPAETIKYADIGFLRRRVKLGNCDKHDDSFTIYLTDRYTEELGERLYNELYGERLVDVILNPCLKNEKVIEVMNIKMADYPENLQMLLETKRLTIDKQELDRVSEKLLMSKLTFLEIENEVSPLFALIVFCHTQLSLYCVNILQQKQIDLTRFNLISALCCNGSIELFNNVLKDHAEESFKKTWGGFCPIHILSVFHNHELLEKLIKKGLKVNQKTDGHGVWTPLMLAAGNDSQEYGDYKHGEAGAIRRDKTVKLLLSNGADINLCKKNGASPLHVACQNGHDSTVQLLLSNGADINLCQKNGASPLYIACQNGHDSTVQLLLSNGADINLCMKYGVSPLYIAFVWRQYKAVNILLNNGVDTSLACGWEVNPALVDCFDKYKSTVEFLMQKDNIQNNLYDPDSYFSLFVSCQVERLTRMIFKRQ